MLYIYTVRKDDIGNEQICKVLERGPRRRPPSPLKAAPPSITPSTIWPRTTPT